MNKKLVLQGLVSAVCEVVYIMIVTLIMNNAQKLFAGDDKIWTGPLTFLLILVISVAVSGALIFGRSVMLYLDGKKKQSVEVFGYTIGWLAVILMVILVVMNLIK